MQATIFKVDLRHTRIQMMQTGLVAIARQTCGPGGIRPDYKRKLSQVDLTDGTL
jgi:hypothetical protein